jgi:hypothetical protein
VSHEVAFAALDSCLPDAMFSPAFEMTVNGSSHTKGAQRAQIIADCVSGLGPGQRVLVIGAVHSIVQELRTRGHSVVACDMDKALMGVRYGDVEVVVGDHDTFSRLLDNITVVIATGMTLVNGTIHAVVRSCLGEGCALILYCQSGAHLAPLLPASWPLLACIAEPYPNYFMAGSSTLRVYFGRAMDERRAKAVLCGFNGVSIE